MTAKEFLDLSTKLFSDMKAWVAEAGKDDELTPSDRQSDGRQRLARRDHAQQRAVPAI